MSVGDSGVLCRIFVRSSTLKPCGRLPSSELPMKLLCRLAFPNDCHRSLSSCRDATVSGRPCLQACGKEHRQACPTTDDAGVGTLSSPPRRLYGLSS